MQHQVQEQGRLIYCHNLTQGIVQHTKINLETDGRLLGRIRGISTVKKTVPETVVLRGIVIGQDEDEQETLIGQRKVLAERQYYICRGEYVLWLPEGQHGPQRLCNAEHKRSAVGHAEHGRRCLHLSTDKVQKSTYQCVGIGALVNGTGIWIWENGLLWLRFCFYSLINYSPVYDGFKCRLSGIETH